MKINDGPTTGLIKQAIPTGAEPRPAEVKDAAPRAATTDFTEAKPLSKPIICPVQGALTKAGLMKLAPSGRTSIPALVNTVAHSLNTTAPAAVMTGSFGFFANSPLGVLRNLLTMSYNPLGLESGLIKHPGDSMILQGGEFHPDRFAELEKHAINGQMTLQSFSSYLQANYERDRKDHPIDTLLRGVPSALTEFGAILNFFGTKNAKGERAISVETLRSFYEKQEIPPEVMAGVKERPTTGVKDLFATMAEMARGMPLFGGVGRAQLGAALANEETPATSRATERALKGVEVSVCPAKGQGGAKSMSGNEFSRAHSAEERQPRS
jgi:hypothetical protein